MARFGIQATSEILPGRSSGGVNPEVVQAIFNKYDSDGSGSISYIEFSNALFHGQEKGHASGSQSSSLPGAFLGHERALPGDEGANPWLPTLNGSVSMDPSYSRPHPNNPAKRVLSIANPKSRLPP